MKLEKVEYPFSDEYVHAYLIINGEGRKTICLTNADFTKRKSMSYARYLMCVKEGRILNKYEEVDHIDNDKTNDVIDNLQRLSPTENKLKYRNSLPEKPHGADHWYRKGCRCELCVAWHRAYHKAWYNSRKVR